jgi:hypothetical protein
MSTPADHSKIVAVARAREQKCTKLAAYLASEFLNVVADSTPEMWAASAAKAGVNMPSAESQARVRPRRQCLPAIQIGEHQ